MKSIFGIVLLFALVSGCRKDTTNESAPQTPARAPTAASAPAQTQTATASAPTVSPPGSYADVVDRVAPGVVTIRAERRVRAPRQHPFFNDPSFVISSAARLAEVSGRRLRCRWRWDPE